MQNVKKKNYIKSLLSLSLIKRGPRQTGGVKHFTIQLLGTIRLLRAYSMACSSSIRLD